MTDPTPTTSNQWCVVVGMPGSEPLTTIGPFVTQEEAQAHLEKHQQANPGVAVMVDVLVNPANC